MIAIGFVFFAAISAICRYGLGGVASPERRAQVEEHAGKLLSVFGATFAFLIGFAITITWSAVGAGQDAVDLQASSAQQLSWATSEIQDKAGADEVNGNLRDYLSTVVSKDGPALAAGEFAALPSAETFDTLQNSVHRVAYGGGTPTQRRAEWCRRLHLRPLPQEGNCGSAAIASGNPDSAHCCWTLLAVTVGLSALTVKSGPDHVCLGVPRRSVCRRGVDVASSPSAAGTNSQPRTATVAAAPFSATSLGAGMLALEPRWMKRQPCSDRAARKVASRGQRLPIGISRAGSDAAVDRAVSMSSAL